MLRLSLSSAGFDTSEVSSGADALRELEAISVDAVVLDLGLPDRLGGAVLEWLRDRHDSRTRPNWVVVSALDEVEATRTYGPLGEHFLSKPFDP